MRLLAGLLIALIAPPVARGEDLPDAATLGRAVFAKFDTASTRTGERWVACGLQGDGLARLVRVKPWKGLGRDQLVAAFALWVVDPETHEPLEFAQACGRSACEVALLERANGSLKRVARGRVEAGCTELDLAPFRMTSTDMLIGVRGYWMNHGFGDTTLTLLRVEGSELRPVLAVPVDVSTPDREETGVVSMLPRADGPADIRIRYTPEGVPDEEGIVKARTPRTELYRWTGSAYAPAERSTFKP